MSKKKLNKNLLHYTHQEDAILVIDKGIDSLPKNDIEFATSLLNQWKYKGYLSDKQWGWVYILAKRITGTTPTKKLCVVKEPVVYCITDHESVKFGYSTNVQKRLKALQTSNSRPLEILWTVPFPTNSHAKGTETRLHKYCKAGHLRGEWFSINLVETARIFVLQHRDRVEDKLARRKTKNENSFRA